MIDKDTFARGMGVLGGAFGREVDGAVAVEYFRVLSAELSTAEFEEAVRLTIATERFWPSPAVLLSKIRETLEETAARELRDVQALIRDHGAQYLPIDKFMTLPLRVRVVIGRLGGIRSLSEIPSEHVGRRWLSAYREAALAPRLPALSAPVGGTVSIAPDAQLKQIQSMTNTIGKGGR